MTATMALYWISVLNGLGEAFTILGILCLVTLVIIAIRYSCAQDCGDYDIAKECLICIKKLVTCFIISLFIYAVVPSSKTMYMMLATHYAGESQLPEKVLKAIEVKLDEIIWEKE